MTGGDIDYHDDKGRRYVGYIALPVHANGAGVLIAHGAPGLGEHERDSARRLAALGYVALAADYHGDGVVLEGEANGPRMAALHADPQLFRDALGAALATLRAQPSVAAARTAAIGYCFGGLGVLELARGGADVPAVAGFHAILPTDRAEDARAIRGKVLIQNATDDPYAPPEMRAAFEQQMNAAGVDWRMILHGVTKHGFTMKGVDAMEKPGIGYHALNDARSWRAMLDLFAETID